ncbi:zinc ribbon domain-containing protein [Catellatospora sp. NPDC049609]|uniref:FmdB family zinc ribbon protein n=1 Tax=Catellatospora sp. NPDC049609 TaxID=3155505 RepID=UPI00341E1D55
MATYEYECADCGRFDVRTAVGAAPPRSSCPACHGDARRVFSPPLLGLLPKAVTALAGREEQSRDEPAVVSRIPPKTGGRPEPAPHPALARLPRP